MDVKRHMQMPARFAAAASMVFMFGSSTATAQVCDDLLVESTDADGTAYVYMVLDDFGSKAPLASIERTYEAATVEKQLVPREILEVTEVETVVGQYPEFNCRWGLPCKVKWKDIRSTVPKMSARSVMVEEYMQANEHLHVKLLTGHDDVLSTMEPSLRTRLEECVSTRNIEAAEEAIDRLFEINRVMNFVPPEAEVQQFVPTLTEFNKNVIDLVNAEAKNPSEIANVQ